MPGFVTFSLALAGLVFGLIRSQAEGWGSLQVLGSLIAAVVLLVAFVVIELRVREPMLDLKLLRVPTFNGGLVAAWAVSASIFSMLTYLVIYFQDLLGYSALAAGLRFLPLTGAVFLVAGIAGRLTTKVPIRLLIGGGFAFVVAGLLLMRGLTAVGQLDAFPSGLHPRGHRRRLHQRAARLDGGGRGAARARRDGARASTRRCARSGSPPAWRRSARSSRARSGRQVVSHLAGTPLAAHAHQLGDRDQRRRHPPAIAACSTRRSRA